MTSLTSEQDQLTEASAQLPQSCFDQCEAEPVDVLEYYHQYLYASRFTKNKRVLNIASGEGYGAAFVSLNAESVIGIDAKDDAVTRASQKYAEFTNLRFEVGGYEDLRILDASVDVTLAFDILAGMSPDARVKMLENIKRVMNTNGLLLISTTIRSADALAAAADKEGSVLPSFSGVDFFEFLKKHFQNVRFIGQKPLTLSAMWSLHEWSDELFRFHVREDLFTLPRGIEMFTEPARIIALCSDEPITAEVTNLSKSVYFDTLHTGRMRKLVKELDDLRHTVGQVRSKNTELSDERDSFRNAVMVLTNENLAHVSKLGDLQKIADDRTQQLSSLEQESATRTAELEELRREHSEQSIWAEKLAAEHETACTAMRELETRLEEATLHASTSSEENVQLRERVQILHRRIEETAEELTKAVETINILQPQLKDIEERYRSLTDTAGEMMSANESLRTQLADLQTAVDEKTRLALEAMARLKEREDYIFTLERQLQEGAQFTREHSAEEETLRGKLSDLETRQEKEGAETAAIHQENQKLHARLYELQKQYDERAALARNASQENEKLAARIGSMQKAIEEKSALVVMLNQEITTQKDKIATLQRDFDQRLQQAHLWEKDNKKKLEHLTELQRKHDEQVLTIRQMRIEFEKQAAAFDTFQKSQGDLQQRYNKSQIKVQELQQEVSIMEQKLQEINSSGLHKVLSRIGFFSPKEK